MFGNLSKMIFIDEYLLWKLSNITTLYTIISKMFNKKVNTTT